MEIYVGAILAVFIGANIAFAIAVKIRRNDLADVCWGLGFLLAAVGGITAKFLAGATTVVASREWIVLICLLAWAARLSFHIGQRFFKSRTEDERYQNMRKGWGANWILRTYQRVFLLQAILLLIVALPILRAIQSGPASANAIVIFGLGVWVFGFIFESVADEQLRRFKLEGASKGKLMIKGLWSWSRHPNYFGEVVQWWGFYLMCFDLAGFWTIISPITITFLILKISGVPMLEKLMENRPGFEDYKNRTSIFFPLPPRKTPTENRA